MISKKNLLMASVLSLVLLLGTVCAVSATDNINNLGSNIINSKPSIFPFVPFCSFDYNNNSDTVDIQLISGCDGGYQWVLDENKSCGVELINSYHVRGSNRLGDSGTDHFIFHYTDRANAHIVMNLERPWSGEIAEVYDSWIHRLCTCTYTTNGEIAEVYDSWIDN